jgi:hypothetical protein
MSERDVVDVRFKLRSPSKIVFDMNTHKSDNKKKELNYSIRILKISHPRFQAKIRRTEHVI